MGGPGINLVFAQHTKVKPSDWGDGTFNRYYAFQFHVNIPT